MAIEVSDVCTGGGETTHAPPVCWAREWGVDIGVCRMGDRRVVAGVEVSGIGDVDLVRRYFGLLGGIACGEWWTRGKARPGELRSDCNPLLTGEDESRVRVGDRVGVSTSRFGTGPNAPSYP